MPTSGCCCCTVFEDDFDDLSNWSQSGSAWTIVSGQASTTTTNNRLYSSQATGKPRKTTFTINGSGELFAKFGVPLIFDTSDNTVRLRTGGDNFRCSIGSPPWTAEVYWGTFCAVVVNSAEIISVAEGLIFNSDSEGFQLLSGSSMTVDDFRSDPCSPPTATCWYPILPRDYIQVTIGNTTTPGLQGCADCTLREGVYVLQKVSSCAYELDGTFCGGLDYMRVEFGGVSGFGYTHTVTISYKVRGGLSTASSTYTWGWPFIGVADVADLNCGDTITIAGPIASSESGSAGLNILCNLEDILIEYA